MKCEQEDNNDDELFNNTLTSKKRCVDLSRTILRYPIDGIMDAFRRDFIDCVTNGENGCIAVNGIDLQLAHRVEIAVAHVAVMLAHVSGQLNAFAAIHSEAEACRLNITALSCSFPLMFYSNV